MTKIRIQNKAQGERGVYVAGDLEFIGKGSTRTFNTMTDGEIATASADGDFRVQREGPDGWVELSELPLPDARPFLVVATDSNGSNYRIIDLKDGEWFVGFAVASDEPDNAQGFDYVKIGGQSEAPVVTEAAAIASGEFDPVAFLDKPAAQLDFEGKPLELLLEAERANKNRKGVIATLEEMLTEPNKDDEDGE